MNGFIVFECLQSSIVPIGVIDNFIGLLYRDYDNEVGSFELEIPYSKKAFDLVKRENETEKLILLDDNTTIGICQKVNPINEEHKKTIKIQGELSEGILSNYCVGLVERLKTATTSPQDLLNFPLSLQYLIQNPPDNISGALWSGINYQLPSDYSDSSWNFEDGYVGGRCTFESYIGSCVRQLKKAYSLEYNQLTGKFDLNLYSPKDRTINQSQNSPVILSTSLGDILSSEYYLNSRAYKNIIVAYSKIRDTTYEQIITYDNIPSDYPVHKRRVQYSEIADISGLDEAGNEMSDEDIYGLLRQKGKQALYDAALLSEYKCKFSQNPTFRYKTDYLMGDTITVQDNELDIALDAKISGYTITKSATMETFEPVIGISQPSLTRILKKKGVI